MTGPLVEDLLQSMALVVAIGGIDTSVHTLRIDGEPPSKARPRFGKGGQAYTSKESRAAERRTTGLLRRSFDEPMTGNVALAAMFYRSGRQRIDADNMLKHLCDAANGVIWLDDSQVTALVGIVEMDAAHPRTILAVAAHSSTMARGTDAMKPCDHCGKPFNTLSVNAARRYCSRECTYAARVNVRPLVTCRHCGEQFRRSTSRQVLCSEACRQLWLTGRRKASTKPPSDCTQCGKRLTHKRGGRCRDCWKTSPLDVPAQPPADDGQLPIPLFTTTPGATA